MPKHFYTDNLEHLYQIFELIVYSTPNVNIREKDNFTPLIFATELDEERLVHMLLENGACKTSQTKHGFYAIDYAIKNENIQLMNILR